VKIFLVALQPVNEAELSLFEGDNLPFVDVALQVSEYLCLHSSTAYVA